MPKLKDLLGKRLGDLEKAGGDTYNPEQTTLHQKQESGEDYPAQVHTKPDTTKTFSDGSVRTWDDASQSWKVIKKP